MSLGEWWWGHPGWGGIKGIQTWEGRSGKKVCSFWQAVGSKRRNGRRTQACTSTIFSFIPHSNPWRRAFPSPFIDTATLRRKVQVHLAIEETAPAIGSFGSLFHAMAALEEFQGAGESLDEQTGSEDWEKEKGGNIFLFPSPFPSFPNPSTLFSPVVAPFLSGHGPHHGQQHCGPHWIASLDLAVEDQSILSMTLALDDNESDHQKSKSTWQGPLWVWGRVDGNGRHRSESRAFHLDLPCAGWSSGLSSDQTMNGGGSIRDFAFKSLPGRPLLLSLFTYENTKLKSHMHSKV